MDNLITNSQGAESDISEWERLPICSKRGGAGHKMEQIAFGGASEGRGQFVPFVPNPRQYLTNRCLFAGGNAAHPGDGQAWKSAIVPVRSTDEGQAWKQAEELFPTIGIDENDARSCRLDALLALPPTLETNMLVPTKHTKDFRLFGELADVASFGRWAGLSECRVGIGRCAASVSRVRPPRWRRYCWRILLLAAAVTGSVAGPALAAAPPRVIIITDPIEIDANYELVDEDLNPAHPETGDPDDIQSLVRFLVYANEFQIEGLIAGSERTDDRKSVVWMNRDHSLYRMLNKYDEIDENLRRHDSGFPTADQLRSKVRRGYSARDGKPGIPGPGKENPGSDLIIEVVDSSAGPIWVLDWVGQPQQFELSQALWQVRRSRTPSELAEFVAKIRANYVVVTRRPGLPGNWLEENFPELFLMGSRSTSVRAFRGLSDNDLIGVDSSLWDRKWIETHVRNRHGLLGAMLPTHTNPNDPGLQDYDSVTFLHLIPNGLSDIEDPSMGNWGGRFHREGNTNRWLPAGDAHPTSSDPAQSIFWAIGRHHRAMQNDFAARMDWCVSPYPNANHNPVSHLNGHSGQRPVRMAASSGTRVVLSAAGSNDPDGHALQYKWWHYHEADSYGGHVQIENPTGREAQFVVPRAQNGEDVHIVLEVTDNGEPALSSYRRLIVTIESLLP